MIKYHSGIYQNKKITCLHGNAGLLTVGEDSWYTPPYCLLPNVPLHHC